MISLDRPATCRGWTARSSARRDLGPRRDQSLRAARARGAGEGRRGGCLATPRFPFATAQARSRVGAAPVLAIRIGYVGELGWELHVPTEYAAHVYERAAGGRRGASASPMPAIAPSTRCAWRRAISIGASDITPDYTPLRGRPRLPRGRLQEGRLHRPRRPRADQGRGPEAAALHLHRSSGRAAVFGGEAILRDGKVLGVTTSGNFGHTIGKPIVLRLPAGRGDGAPGLRRSRSSASRHPAAAPRRPALRSANERLKA